MTEPTLADGTIVRGVESYAREWVEAQLRLTLPGREEALALAAVQGKIVPGTRQEFREAVRREYHSAAAERMRTQPNAAWQFQQEVHRINHMTCAEVNTHRRATCDQTLGMINGMINMGMLFSPQPLPLPVPAGPVVPVEEMSLRYRGEDSLLSMPLLPKNWTTARML